MRDFLHNHEVETLEEMLDNTSVSVMLTGLAHLCFVKSQHIQDNSQDGTAARLWERRGHAIEAVRDLNPDIMKDTP